MVEVRQTDFFKDWFAGLGDANARRRIAQRIVRLQSGLLGDVKPVGEGVSELRIDYGPGYRLYFVRMEQTSSFCSAAAIKGRRSANIIGAKTLAAEV